MDTQERWDVEAIGAQRSDRLGDISPAEPNLVGSSTAESKGADVDENVRALGKSLPQFGADDPLVSEPEADLRRRWLGIVYGRSCPLGTAMAGCAAESGNHQADLSEQGPAI